MPHRKAGNLIFLLLVNILFGTSLGDILSGYRVFSKKIARDMAKCESNGFEIETEMTIRAVKNKFQIREVPIRYDQRPKGSWSKLNAFSDGLKIMRTILKMRFR